MIPFVSKEDLLWKNKRGVLIVVVCGEVRAPKPQLPLRCGPHCSVRDAEQHRHLKLNVPIIVLARLRNSKTYLRAGKPVEILTRRRLEKIPGFVALADVARKRH